jgi:phosphatidylserine/phosphatidylglycerophosphate/cardiolipin synthase-like enzyme
MDADPSLEVRLCLDVARPAGDTSHPSEILGRFAHRFRTREWPGQRLPEVLYDPRALELEPARRASLHGKCVVVDERRAFVSSANFTEAGQVRNIEIGVLVELPSIAQQLARGSVPGRGGNSTQTARA